MQNDLKRPDKRRNNIPPPPGPGRPPGLKNKLTTDLKHMIRQALDESGGVEYLKVQAKENPKAFMSLLGRIIPVDVDVTNKQINVMIGLYPGEQPVIIEQTVEQSKLSVTHEAG